MVKMLTEAIAIKATIVLRNTTNPSSRLFALEP
jgi:hypothetical protein